MSPTLNLTLMSPPLKLFLALNEIIFTKRKVHRKLKKKSRLRIERLYKSLYLYRKVLPGNWQDLLKFMQMEKEVTEISWQLRNSKKLGMRKERNNNEDENVK